MSDRRLAILSSPKGSISPALPLVSHTLSPRLKLVPFNSCCCPWWLSYGTSITKMLGLPLELVSSPMALSGLSSGSLTLLHGAKPQLLPTTSSVLGHLLQLRLHIQPCPLLTSHGAKPQLLSMTTTCLQNQYHLGDSCRLSSLASGMGCSLCTSKQLLCTDLR